MSNKSQPTNSLKTISDFAKRTGFVYQGSEIYGGLANTWDYGPKGILLKNNIKEAWRQHFITSRTDMVEVDAGIFMNPKVWEASGHVGGFADCMIDCKECKSRFRADHLIEEACDIDVEGWTPEQITATIDEKKINCPKCKAHNWTEARYMNLMFETNRDKIGNDPAQRIYLRPETAQGIFVNFKNVLQTERRKLPFGIGQIGKAFRNEITPGNFNFRVIEFEQMEIEYFIKSPTSKEEWNTKFEELLALQQEFLTQVLGFNPANVRPKEHSVEKLSHYSKRTVDLEYNYPFGFSELTGNAYRTDFDLSQHSKDYGTFKESKTNLEYLDPETNEKYIPHCIEPTVGVDRLLLAVLCDFFTEEALENDTRVLMKFPFNLAPYKIAVLPLMKKDGMSEKANEIYLSLKKQGNSCAYDESGSIGKRYRRQDENGTPWCMCVDFTTLEDNTVTLRHRDTMEQVRVSLDEVVGFLSKEKFGK
jgi:glycyl-tRNA synthetase